MPTTKNVNLLEDKVALVTGGLTGIGRAISVGFAQHGCRVAINYLPCVNEKALIESIRNELDALSTAPASENVIFIPGDVSKVATSTSLVTATVENWGRLDVFVSNAGICQFADFLSMDPELYSRTVDVNLSGAFYTTQAAARQMSTQLPPGGSIIAISSISALVGGEFQTHYTPTKAGVSSLMQSCAIALGKHKIRCNALLPGTIRTALNEQDLKDDGKRTYMEGRIPLGRLGQPSDLVGPAVFLASDMSQYMTGAQLLVDGGLFVNLQ